jgi:hypothetical protein
MNELPHSVIETLREDGEFAQAQSFAKHCYRAQHAPHPAPVLQRLPLPAALCHDPLTPEFGLNTPKEGAPTA